MQQPRNLIRRIPSKVIYRNFWNKIFSVDFDDLVLYKPGSASKKGLYATAQDKWFGEYVPIPKLSAFSDIEYGGDSSSYIEVIGENSLEEKGENEEKLSNFLRFTGSLKFDNALKQETKASGGFCALKIDYPESIDLLNFEGLEFYIRSTTTQQMTLNMTCHTFVQDDIFQLDVQLRGSPEWRKIYAPFNLFFLTRRGRVLDHRMNDSLQLQSLGILLRHCDQGFNISFFRVNLLNRKRIFKIAFTDTFKLDIGKVSAVKRIPDDVRRKYFSKARGNY